MKPKYTSTPLKGAKEFRPRLPTDIESIPGTPRDRFQDFDPSTIDESMRSEEQYSDVVADSVDEGNESEVSRDRSQLITPQKKSDGISKRFDKFTPQTRKDREARLSRQRNESKKLNFSLDEEDEEGDDDDDDDDVLLTSYRSKAPIIASDEEDEEGEEVDDATDSPQVSKKNTSDDEDNDESSIIAIESSSQSEKDSSMTSETSIQEVSKPNSSKNVSTGSYDNPVTLSDSSEDEDDSAKSARKPQIVFTVQEKKAIQHMSRQQITDSLSSLRSINLQNAPDGGAKVSRRIALLENRLKELPVEIEVLSDEEKPKAVKKPVMSQTDMDRFLETGNRLYGGQMTEARIEKVQTVTEEVIQRMHGSIHSAPVDVATETPKGLSVELLRHQKYGLTWMVWREQQFPRGGILADDMGLGKTMSMISLIVAQKNARTSSEEVKAKMIENMKKHFRNDTDVVPAFSTLVVAPASVILQWQKEIETRLHPNQLSVYVFHGPNREKNPRRLAKYDVVITTFQIITSELTEKKAAGAETDDSDDDVGKGGKMRNVISKTAKSVLTKIGWERIILDEAHQIKNRKSLQSKGCCRLPAYARWCLTGTPIHNNLWDLFSLIRFLRVTPFGEEKLWKEFIERGGQVGHDRLNTLIKGLLLRRTKTQMCSITSKPLVELTTRSFEVVKVSLEGLEYTCYQQMFEVSRQKAKEMINNQDMNNFRRPTFKSGKSVVKNPFLGGAREVDLDDNFQVMSCLLVLLLRLRQACVHMALTRNAVDLDAFEVDGGQMPDVIDELEQTFGNVSLSEGALLEEGSDGRIIGVADIFEPKFASAKIKALLSRLDNVIECGDKCVIVSQWTSMLDIVEVHLKKYKVPYTSITGQIPTKDRQPRIDSFNETKGGARVMLLSLSAGGVGLNLIGGNHLFLTDLHWNPALEQQACDRIYRVGQTKNCFIHKFVCNETIESRVLALQEQKSQLASSVLEGASKKMAKLSMNDLKYLFELNSRRPGANPSTAAN